MAMTINKVIAQADKLRMNAVDPELKAGWVLELEQRLVREVVLNSDPVPEVDPPTEWVREADKPLTVAAPYDGIYVLYLVAKLDFANADIEEYNNAVAAFEAAYGNWERAYRREHRPKSHGGIVLR